MVAQCVLCIEDLKIYDLVRMMPCGHFYHNSCFLNYNNKRCAICRNLNDESAAFCYATDTDTNIIDPTPQQFRNLIRFNKSNVSMIEFKKKQENIQYNKEKLQKHQKIFQEFVKENLVNFRFKILQASSAGKSSTVIYSCDFEETYKELPMLYVLKGTKKEGLDFFERYNVSSVIDLLNENFSHFNIMITSDYLLKKNYIKIHF